MEILAIITIFIILNLIIYFNLSSLSKIINIYDLPDTKRKMHSQKVAVLGGAIIFFNLCVVGLIKIIFPEVNFFETNLINSSRNFISFFVISSAIFLIGLYDDKFGIRATKKLFLCALALLVFLQLNPDLQIRILKFSFYAEPIYLNEFSLIFTIICFLLIINALNMFDGINLQVGLFCLVVFTFFYFNNFSVLFSLIMIVPLVTFLILNYNNKCFLGDSGCYLLAFLIAVIIIHYYNLQLYIDNGKEINADHIFILLMLPGIDMLRLFVYRVANGKNPFEGDNHHIHHLFVSRYGLNNSNLIIQSIVILPLILMQIFPSLVIIIISLLTYSYLIYFMYLRQK